MTGRVGWNVWGWILAWGLLAAAAGCSGDDDQDGTKPEFCTLDEDCPQGKVCRWGTCRPPEDAGVQGEGDAGEALDLGDGDDPGQVDAGVDEDGGGRDGGDGHGDAGDGGRADSGEADAGEADVGGGDLGPADGGEADQGPPCLDEDGDGYGEGEGCLGPDCNDGDPRVNPGREEIPYNSQDDDCSGGDLVDVDGDGFVAIQAGGDDCDDTDPDVHPGADELPGDGIDQDCQGGDCLDLDGDGYGEGFDCVGLDCDDEEPGVHPGADEIPYDGVDQDCDGLDLTDVDGDGFVAVEAGGDDCDDSDPQVHPGAVDEPGDGIDQDCSGADGVLPDQDQDNDGYVAVQAGGDDCDDLDPTVHPGALEVPYDGIDQDCVGGDDDDLDGDGFPGVLAEGGTDCDDLDPDVNPGEVEKPYNGRDDDCDPETSDSDLDGDGFDGVPGGGEDCDDSDPGVHPGAEEIPYDGVDQDCDPGTPDDDLDGDGFPNDSDCDDSDPERSPGLPEVMDGKDNDCDGEVDEAPGQACPDHPDMVLVPQRGCIDRYEASREDATSEDQGNSDSAAISRAGVLPWTSVTLDEARAACEAAGKVLCPPDLWWAGCNLPGVAYPYGGDYQPVTCNGADAARGGPWFTGAGESCVSPVGAFDMSGNLAEWVDYQNPQSGAGEALGGGWLEGAGDLTCAASRFLGPESREPWLGFRCCITLR